MIRASRTDVTQRLLPWWAALGATLTASCLLTTSLDGLEGPPISVDAGGSDGATADRSEDGSDGGRESGADAGLDAAADADPGRDAMEDRGNAADAPIDGGAGDVTDGTPIGPIRVADAGGALGGIAEYDKYVYWVQMDGRPGIVRAPKAGGGPSTFVDMAMDAFDVAVDADYVYWSTGTGNEVFRKLLGLTGADGMALFSGAGQTFYLAAGSSDRVFVTGLNAVTVGPRVDAGFGDAIYKFQNGAAGVAFDGTYVYWSFDSGIVRGEPTGLTAPLSVYDGVPGEVLGIATDAEDIYWIGPDGVIRAKSITSPTPSPRREVCRGTFQPSDADVADARADGMGGSFIADVAVDETWVYFTEPAIHQISKCPKR